MQETIDQMELVVEVISLPSLENLDAITPFPEEDAAQDAAFDEPK